MISPPAWRPVKEPSLGVGYVASMAKVAGFDVSGFDANLEEFSFDRIKGVLEEIQPNVVGLSALTVNMREASLLADWTKEVLPETTVVLGGAHATLCPENILQEETNIDFLIIGEGEHTFVKLLRHLVSKRHISSLPGTAYRTDNGTVNNGLGQAECDLDELPFPDRDVLSYDRYRSLAGYAPLITTRGCPYSCQICCVPRLSRNHVRYRSIDNVISEVEDLLARGFAHINFRDNVFTLNPKRTMKFCRRLQTFSLSYSCETRPDLVDMEIMEAMVASGLCEIRFGAESLNQRTLDRIDKRIAVESIQKGVEIALDAGVPRVRVSFVLGIPGETFEDLIRTIEFAESLHPAECRFWPFNAWPGVMVGELGEECDVTVVSSPISSEDVLKPTVETSSLSLRQLEQALNLAWERHGHPLSPPL